MDKGDKKQKSGKVRNKGVENAIGFSFCLFRDISNKNSEAKDLPAYADVIYFLTPGTLLL